MPENTDDEACDCSIVIEEQSAYFAERNALRPILMSWSGGKDSCLALHEIQKSSNSRVVALLTTITREHDSISMHGVRRRLLETQAASLGLPLFLKSVDRKVVWVRLSPSAPLYLLRFASRLEPGSTSAFAAV